MLSPAWMHACLNPMLDGFSIHDHVQENGGRDYVLRQIEHATNKTVNAEDGTRTIKITPSNRHEAWRELQQALLARRDKCQIFVCAMRWSSPTGERSPHVLRLSDVAARHAVVFTKFDGR